MDSYLLWIFQSSGVIAKELNYLINYTSFCQNNFHQPKHISSYLRYRHNLYQIPMGLPQKIYETTRKVPNMLAAISYLINNRSARRSNTGRLLIALIALAASIFPTSGVFAFEDKEEIWYSLCLEKVLKHYQGPSPEDCAFSDSGSGFRLMFSLYPDSSIRWIHEEQAVDSNTMSKRTTQNQAFMNAIKDALKKASPFPPRPATLIKSRCLPAILPYDPEREKKLEFHIFDCAGFWRADLRNLKQNQETTLVSGLLKELALSPPPIVPPRLPVYAAIWFVITPDGTIERIAPVRCTREAAGKKAGLSAVIKTQAAMKGSISKLSKTKLKALIGDTDTPQGMILIYRSDKNPSLLFREYAYYRCPDAVFL